MADSLLVLAVEAGRQLEAGNLGDRYISSLHNLGDTYRKKGEFSAADSIFCITVEYNNRIRGLKDRETRTVFFSYALLKLELQQFALADSLLLEVLPYALASIGIADPESEEALSVFSTQDIDPNSEFVMNYVDIVFALGTLGDSAKAQHRTQEAHAYYQRAFDVLKSIIPEDHFLVQNLLENLEETKGDQTP